MVEPAVPAVHELAQELVYIPLVIEFIHATVYGEVVPGHELDKYVLVNWFQH